MLRSIPYFRDTTPLICAASLFLSFWPAALLAATPEAAPVAPSMDYGWMLFRMIMVLAMVCVFAYVVLRWGVKRFVTPDMKGGPIEVVARMPVEPRRSVMLIRVGERLLVVGSSEAGMQRLGELPVDEVDLTVTQEPTRSFADVLDSIRNPPDKEVFHVKHEEAP